MSNEPVSVVVLGASGMLGWAVTNVLGADPSFKVTATLRGGRAHAAAGRFTDGVALVDFDVEAALQGEAGWSELPRCDWVINCIGIIKSHINDSNDAHVSGAIAVNATFPYALSEWAAARKCRVLQIATDCVYSGAVGSYGESAPHDALDVYGKTKSLGEVHAGHFHNIRCSVIGPELQTHKSLLDWFLGQPKSATVSGYTNHHWNGVTALHFGLLCAGIMRNKLSLPHLVHITPSGPVCKADLLSMIARGMDRADVSITRAEATGFVDRTLTTEDAARNAAIWAAAGYATIPSVELMVQELATWMQSAAR